VHVGLIYDLTTDTNLLFNLTCVFLGYSFHHKGYRCLHVPSGSIYISRNVVFDENNFPFQNPSVSAAPPTNSLCHLPLLSQLFPSPHVTTTLPPHHHVVTPFPSCNNSIPLQHCLTCLQHYPCSSAPQVSPLPIAHLAPLISLVPSLHADTIQEPYSQAT
jgi:hypothetical protein